VAFYVPLGLKGVLLRIGTLLIGVWGALVYRINCWRRGAIRHRAEPLTIPAVD
jgi:hypothetical protein